MVMTVFVNLALGYSISLLHKGPLGLFTHLIRPFPGQGGFMQYDHQTAQRRRADVWMDLMRKNFLSRKESDYLLGLRRQQARFWLSNLRRKQALAVEAEGHKDQMGRGYQVRQT